MVSEFNKALPLAGRQILDLGASIHGFALEKALALRAARYEGIDFDIERHWKRSLVEFADANGRIGRLQQMNAEALDFPENSFDGLITLSTFEHFERPAAVLAEMHRVLKPGGRALVSFEPVWTASYGHHLHHWGAISDLVPPWSHLFLSEQQMGELLAGHSWPADAPITREHALQWIYHDRDINRLTIGQIRQHFAESHFHVVWEFPLMDDVTPAKQAAADYVSRVVGIESKDLLTKGLSLLLEKR
jgi:SAM-dependent methyltransferase